jgi:hypothetical protein
MTAHWQPGPELKALVGAFVHESGDDFRAALLLTEQESDQRKSRLAVGVTKKGINSVFDYHTG